MGSTPGQGSNTPDAASWSKRTKEGTGIPVKWVWQASTGSSSSVETSVWNIPPQLFTCWPLPIFENSERLCLITLIRHIATPSFLHCKYQNMWLSDPAPCPSLFRVLRAPPRAKVLVASLTTANPALSRLSGTQGGFKKSFVEWKKWRIKKKRNGEFCNYSS